MTSHKENKMYRRYRSKNKAFTLIELLVVISIIALLMAIMLPALGRARQIAKATICQSNSRQIAQAVYIYAADNDDRVPPCRPGHPSSGPKHSWSSKYAVEWYYLVLEAAGAFEPSQYDDVYIDQEFKFNSFAHCPSWLPPESSQAWDWGYGMNTQLLYYDKRTREQLDPTGTYSLSNTNFLKAPRISQIPDPATMVYAGESPHYWFQPATVSWLSNKDEWLMALQDSKYPKPAPLDINWNVARRLQWSLSDPYRHMGSATYAFIDGHSERLKGDSQSSYDLFRKRWDDIEGK
jgi:prepilin-type N-terminal cleavage/methylation domain-containing protein/prepilin-type processing-associated H-X9-DG protein